MTFHIISLFPEVLEAYVNSSMLWRAQKEKKVRFKFYNPRDYTKDKHRKVDGRPYGGGPGMVMAVQPVIGAAQSIRKKLNAKRYKLKAIIMSPAGKQFTNVYAKNLSKKYTDIALICGHYEGIDARVKKILKKEFGSVEEISVGPYVLTGGEVPAMAVMDAVSRQIEGVLGHPQSLEEKRTAAREAYTRPEIFEYKGKKYRVPKVLLTGHHANIEKWRAEKDQKSKTA